MLLCFIWLHVVDKFSFLWFHVSFIFLTRHEPTVLQYCYHDLIFVSVFFLFNFSLSFSISLQFPMPIYTFSCIYLYNKRSCVHFWLFQPWQISLSCQSRSLTQPLFSFLGHVSQYFPGNEDIKVLKIELERHKGDRSNRRLAI